MDQLKEEGGESSPFHHLWLGCDDSGMESIHGFQNQEAMDEYMAKHTGSIFKQITLQQGREWFDARSRQKEKRRQ